MMLTFDDGPSTRKKDNPTEIILQVLARNPVQDGIKAIFFTQTRLGSNRHGEITKRLLLREHEEGHVLAVHEGARSSLRSHRGLKGKALDSFLTESQDQLQQISGQAPRLIRPPFWAFNERTQAAYQRHGLHMLLTDVSAGDGKSWGFRANPRRRNHLAGEMQAVRQRMVAGELPEVDGVMPIIVTFHDTNTWTADHMEEYLALLIEAAVAADIELDEEPFYGQGSVMEHAAIKRSENEQDPVSLVPAPWRWLWF
ncbi:MAG TPA: polysaccharide deacetylase family protein [Xanthomonadales bacterium]|nr:polysaccharide deacetylase family protein [Xanthomonadales bacterium]